MTGSSTPAPCILPAIINPSKCFFANFIAFKIALFETPVPGFPVKQIKLKPNSLAFKSVLGDTIRPIDISALDSFIGASMSTGSRFTPIARPVALFIQVIGFSDKSSGTPCISGSKRSSALNRIKSAPAALSNSAFVTASPI